MTLGYQEENPTKVGKEDLRPFESNNGKIVVNPLANFGQKFVDEYFENHSLPKHPLLDEGFVCRLHTAHINRRIKMTQGQVDGLIKQKLSVEYTIRKTKMDVHLKNWKVIAFIFLDKPIVYKKYLYALVFR